MQQRTFVNEVKTNMENKMSFSDTASLYFNQPMMLCSDVETMNRFVPDFDKTEDWLQLVMHEYFHSFQFSHSATINYLAETIQMSADTLNKIYLGNEWFKKALETENLALLKAIGSTTKDSLEVYVDEFLQARESRRMKYKEYSEFDLSTMENFWETIEGPARYVEYCMAGDFNQITMEKTIQCDSLFNNFDDYKGQLNFEAKPEFQERIKIMQAYYYVTGFNMCRLMDKMGIDYKQNLFSNPTEGLYKIFVRNTSR